MPDAAARLDVGVGLSPAEMGQITGASWNPMVLVVHQPDPDDASADTGWGDSRFVPQRPCAFALGAGRDHGSFVYGTGWSSYRKRTLAVGDLKVPDAQATQVAAVYPDAASAAAVLARLESAVHGCAQANATVDAGDQFRWQCSDFTAPTGNGCVAEVQQLGNTLIEVRAALPDRNEKYVAAMADRMAGKVASVQPRAVAVRADKIALTGDDVDQLDANPLHPQMIFTNAPDDYLPADCTTGDALGQQESYGNDWQAFRSGAFYASPNGAFHQVVALYPDEKSAAAAYTRLADAVRHCPTGKDGITVATDTQDRIEWHSPADSPGSAPDEVWALLRTGTTVLEVHTTEFGADLATKAVQELVDRAR